MFNLFFFCKYNDYFLNILHFNIFLCKIEDFFLLLHGEQ